MSRKKSTQYRESALRSPDSGWANQEAFLQEVTLVSLSLTPPALIHLSSVSLAKGTLCEALEDHVGSGVSMSFGP